MGAPQRRRGKVSELGRAPLLELEPTLHRPRGGKKRTVFLLTHMSIMLDDRRHVAAEPPTLSYVLGAGLIASLNGREATDRWQSSWSIRLPIICYNLLRLY